MKKCSKCNENKPLDCYSKNNRKKDGLQTWCRTCKNSHHLVFYKKNKVRWLKSNAITRSKTRKKLWDYLKNKSCKVCGESDPMVLEFDHLDPKTKTGNIGNLARSRSWSVVEQEIQKCQILCANCHKRKTAKQFGWYQEFQKTI